MVLELMQYYNDDDNDEHQLHQLLRCANICTLLISAFTNMVSATAALQVSVQLGVAMHAEVVQFRCVDEHSLMTGAVAYRPANVGVVVAQRFAVQVVYVGARVTLLTKCSPECVNGSHCIVVAVSSDSVVGKPWVTDEAIVGASLMPAAIAVVPVSMSARNRQGRRNWTVLRPSWSEKTGGGVRRFGFALQSTLGGTLAKTQGAQATTVVLAIGVEECNMSLEQMYLGWLRSTHNMWAEGEWPNVATLRAMSYPEGVHRYKHRLRELNYKGFTLARLILSDLLDDVECGAAWPVPERPEPFVVGGHDNDLGLVAAGAGQDDEDDEVGQRHRPHTSRTLRVEQHLVATVT